MSEFHHVHSKLWVINHKQSYCDLRWDVAQPLLSTERHGPMEGRQRGYGAGRSVGSRRHTLPLAARPDCPARSCQAYKRRPRPRRYDPPAQNRPHPQGHGVRTTDIYGYIRENDGVGPSAKPIATEHITNPRHGTNIATRTANVKLPFPTSSPTQTRMVARTKASYGNKPSSCEWLKPPLYFLYIIHEREKNLSKNLYF
jgi:hypothetical protein